MSGDMDDLKSLEDRLKKARGDNKTESKAEDQQASPIGIAWKLGIELVIAVVLGLVLGKAIDDWLGLSPIGLLSGLFLGFGAGVRNVVRASKQMQVGLENDEAKE